jgi:carboxypeptidase Q
VSLLVSIIRKEMSVFVRALVAVALIAPLLSAQAPAGAARPPQGDRNPMADPINIESVPAYIRRTPATDATIQRIWDEGMNRSQAMTLAQQLMDPLGQRMTGSPQSDAAQDWLLKTYQSWGVTARKERYGTWLGWERGVTHVDLISPRVRSLEATALAYSPGMQRPATGDVIAYPANVTTPEEFDAWLPNVRGKFFLMNAPRLSCRSPGQWNEFGTPEERERITAEQTALQTAWGQTNVAMSGGRSVWQKLKDAGALGVFTHQFSNYPGIQKIFGSPQQTLPSFAVGCEDYGLLFRMSRAGQAPRVRAFTDSKVLGERPVFNVVAEIRGSEKPDEYVLLSAHFDSWSSASGATDNGTGTITMMEALRILRTVYPAPKRTILVGHWNGEEQGLNGSRAFSEDHPEVIAGLQALWNQDNGTGRIVNLSAGPFPGASTRIQQYLGQIPNEITRWIRFNPTSGQATGGTDHASFVCHKTPAFNLGALGWDYSFTTWHTDRDTYDKVVEYDLKNNATLVAMLAYLASEDPDRMPRDVMDPLPAGPNGQPGTWRACGQATRATPPATR